MVASYSRSHSRCAGPLLFARFARCALFDDLRHHAGTDGAPTLANREAQPLLHRNRRNQRHRHPDVVPRHHHLRPPRQLHAPRHVRRAEIKLRPITIEERRVPPALFLGEHVHLAAELGVRRDRRWLRQHLPPLHLLTLRAPEKHPDVVPRLPLIQQLPEHLHPRTHRLRRRLQTHDLQLLPHLHPPPRPPPRPHPPPPAATDHAPP